LALVKALFLCLATIKAVGKGLKGIGTITVLVGRFICFDFFGLVIVNFGQEIWQKKGEFKLKWIFFLQGAMFCDFETYNY